MLSYSKQHEGLQDLLKNALLLWGYARCHSSVLPSLHRWPLAHTDEGKEALLKTSDLDFLIVQQPG